jgi:transposase
MLQRLIDGRTKRELAVENRRLRAEVDRLRDIVAEIEPLRAQIAELQATVAQQQEQIEQLEAKLATNSRNSSKPPSSDPPGAPPRRGKKRGRKRGGQPGHEGATRKLVATEEVDEVVVCRPTSCQSCGALLLGVDPAPQRRQVIDIPTPKVVIREYQLHELGCLVCGQRTRGELPVGVGPSPFGPGLHALSALLVGRFRQSKRLVAEMLAVLFGLEMSPGSVCAMERRMSEALAVPVREVRAAIREETVVGSDETSWRALRQKAWLWIAATEKVAVFTIARRRSSKVVQRILGEAFVGVVVSDRWSAYAHLERRQLCWAHLLRDFIAMVERFNSPWHGNRLALCAVEVMAAYAQREAGHISHDEMVRRLQPVRDRTQRRLRWAANNAPGPKARAKAREILKLEPHLWTFLDDPTVPVTNNLCERLLRYAVIWRKLSYGTQSTTGARFMERILTVCATLQLQDRNVFDYLTDAAHAHFSGQAAASILPSTS